LDKFETVDPKPLNSGCIAQVHLAKLKPEAAANDVDPVQTLIQKQQQQQEKEENEELAKQEKVVLLLDKKQRHLSINEPVPVVIKVMHPDVMKTLVTDVLCLSWGAFLIEKVISRTFYSGVRQSVEEFSALLLTQLDFVREAENLNQFRYNFRTSSTTVFPRPYLSITKPEILVESYEVGQPLSSLKDEQTKVGGMHESLATVAVSAFLQMLFRDNLVHADLHPGNLLARVRNKDGSISLFKDPNTFKRSELVILDPGLVTTLSQRERTNFISLFACVATGDGDLGAKVMLEWMPNLSDCDDVPKYESDMKTLFDELCPKSLSLADFDISYIMHRILATMRDHKVRFDMNFATLLSSIALSESVGKVLQAKQNVFEVSAPYLVDCLNGHELMFLIEKVYKRYLSDKWKVSLSQEDQQKM
jgi:aarF domain-containing kinase